MKELKLKKNFLLLFLFVLCIGTEGVSKTFAQSSLTHGYQVCLDKGLVIDALTFPGKRKYWEVDGKPRWYVDHPLNLTNWSNSNFNSVNTWKYTSPPTNGESWGYWYEDSTNLLVDTADPYLGFENLLYVQYGDEQNISYELSGYASKVAELKTFYPDQIIYMNNSPGSYGGSHNQIPINTLRNFTTTVKPDMLHFTEYPFRWQGTDYLQNYSGGSPESMYIRMEMYRKVGLEGLTGDGSQPIPVGMYVEHFNQVNNTYVNGRLPTESEVRLQTFVGWAFGFRKTSSFVYETTSTNTFDTLLFDGAGDDNPSSRFNEIAEMNRQSQNLSNALVRLISTDVRMKMGYHNPLPAGVGVWDSSADAHLKEVSAMNLGTKNDGYYGDVIVGFFKPLDASLVEEGAEDDTYFMIVNGLTDETGDAEDCRQKISLEFDFTGTDITQLLRVSRDTGEVEVVSLINEGSGIFSVDLILDGGTGDLFKYDTGTAFVPEPTTLLMVLAGFGVLCRKKEK